MGTQVASSKSTRNAKSAKSAPAKSAKSAKAATKAAAKAPAYDMATVLDAAVRDLGKSSADVRQAEWTIARIAYEATIGEGVKATDAYAQVAARIAKGGVETRLTKPASVSGVAQAWRVFGDSMPDMTVWDGAVWAGAHKAYLAAHPGATRADYVKEVRAHRAATGARPATRHADGRPKWHPEGKARPAKSKSKAPSSASANAESTAHKQLDSAEAVIIQVKLTGALLKAFRAHADEQEGLTHGDVALALLRHGLDTLAS